MFYLKVSDDNNLSGLVSRLLALRHEDIQPEGIDDFWRVNEMGSIKKRPISSSNLILKDSLAIPFITHSTLILISTLTL